jgi:hypothetical protein
MNHGRVCPYVAVAVSAVGQVACFGGDVDLFTSWGEKTGSIRGNYNHGAFDSRGRLIVQQVSTTTSDTVTVTAHRTHDVVSMCDCFAIDQSGKQLAVVHRGKLFLFCASVS